MDAEMLWMINFSFIINKNNSVEVKVVFVCKWCEAGNFGNNQKYDRLLGKMGKNMWTKTALASTGAIFLQNVFLFW